MTKHASPTTAPHQPRTRTLRRAVTAALTALVLIGSFLASAPPAYAGTDDYPAKWRDIPIDSVFDTWRMYNRECTSFVAFRLSSRNGFEMPFHNDAGGWGADARARGYTVDTKPAPGAVAWWSYGHLAWVEAVNADGSVVTEEYNWRVGGVPDGAYHRRTIAASAPTGYIHFKDLAAPAIPNGSFVTYGGTVYRIAGGAPLHVSNWAALGGQQPTTALSDAQWTKLRQYPVDGTFVTGKPSGQVFRTTGGAPLPVTDWAAHGGVQPTVAIGDDSIRNAGTTDAASPWSHLRARLAGSDRFATSAAISAAGFAPGVPVAYIASGLNFPDALSAAPVAGKTGAPLLLVQPGSIPAAIRAELVRLRPGRIVVLGGAGSVGDTVARQLAALAPGGVTRLQGPDRFATSAAISAANFSAGVPVVYLTNGHKFPDALSGAPVAGTQGAPVLLVQGSSIPAVIQAELDRLRATRIVVLGGEGAVAGAMLP